MTNALVHKTGAAIQWARDYGQAHPKIQGIFWIISTAILTIVPNELVKFMWKFTGKNIAEFAVTAITIPILFMLQKEQCRKFMGRRIPMLALAGILPAALWLCFNREGRINVNGDTSAVNLLMYYCLHLMDISLIIPLYEEKIVRGLLLRGIEKLTGSLGAIIITSFLFGVAHRGNEWLTFVYGAVLAWAATCMRMGAFERSIIYGAYNFTIGFYVLFYMADI